MGLMKGVDTFGKLTILISETTCLYFPVHFKPRGNSSFKPLEPSRSRRNRAATGPGPPTCEFVRDWKAPILFASSELPGKPSRAKDGKRCNAINIRPIFLATLSHLSPPRDKYQLGTHPAVASRSTSQDFSIDESMKHEISQRGWKKEAYEQGTWSNVLKSDSESLKSTTLCS